MKKFAVLLVALCMVIGMNGFAFGQTLVSFDMWANGNHLLYESEVDNLCVTFEAHNGGALAWSGNATDTPGTVYYTYVPAVIVYDHWHVVINAPWWLVFDQGNPNPSNAVAAATHYFQWNVTDNRP